MSSVRLRDALAFAGVRRLSPFAVFDMPFAIAQQPAHSAAAVEVTAPTCPKPQTDARGGQGFAPRHGGGAGGGKGGWGWGGGAQACHITGRAKAGVPAATAQTPLNTNAWPKSPRASAAPWRDARNRRGDLRPTMARAGLTAPFPMWPRGGRVTAGGPTRPAVILLDAAA